MDEYIKNHNKNFQKKVRFFDLTQKKLDELYYDYCLYTLALADIPHVGFPDTQRVRVPQSVNNLQLITSFAKGDLQEEIVRLNTKKEFDDFVSEFRADYKKMMAEKFKDVKVENI